MTKRTSLRGTGMRCRCPKGSKLKVSGTKSSYSVLCYRGRRAVAEPTCRNVKRRK